MGLLTTAASVTAGAPTSVAPGATDVALRRGLLFTMALPAIMQGFMHAPAASLLQGIYAKHAALPLAALGTAVLLTRLFDAITDPLIGHLSDVVHRKIGTRKPWVIAGTLITALGLWHLYRPPADVTILYFTIWFMVAYLGWTVTEIPYRAWSLELTSDYDQRTRISAWITIALLTGTLIFYLTPLMAASLGLVSTTEVNLEALGLAAVVIVVLTPLLNLFTVLRAPDGFVDSGQHRDSARELWRSIVSNRPLMYFTGIFLLYGIATGMNQGVAYLYVDTYLGLAKQLAALLILTMVAQFTGTPVWAWACRRYEKHRAWSVSLALQGVSLFGLGLVPPGEAGLAPVIVVLFLYQFSLAAMNVAAPAIIGDIIDHGRLTFGRDRAGMYLSFYTMMVKTLSGMGVALGLILLGTFGFDATATHQSPVASFGVQFVVGFGPGLCLLAMAPLLWRFPITRARHEEEIRALRESGSHRT